MTIYKDVNTISFDNGETVYNITDENAIHTSDATSAYSSSGTSSIDGISVASAISTKSDRAENKYSSRYGNKRWMDNRSTLIELIMEFTK